MLEKFKVEFFDLFQETFEKVQGYYLDRGTSLFETLDTISAEAASRPISATCASIAAQVEHINFYLTFNEAHMRGQDPGKANWNEIWERVREVTPEEWEASKRTLKESYQRITELMRSFDTWETGEEVSGALAMLVHTAYHLGEIRQALCTVIAQNQ
jgi:hypothetical protein